MDMFTVLVFFLSLSQEDLAWARLLFPLPTTLTNSKLSGVVNFTGLYPRSKVVFRCKVPEDKISWDVEYPEYNPPYYTSPSVLIKRHADNEDVTMLQGKWNDIDNDKNRCSFVGAYKVVDGYPLNPTGRTGLKGRGALNKWGPNLVGSLIATKWKGFHDGYPIRAVISNLPILQALLIRKVGSNLWNVPLTFINPGELVKQAMQRLFLSKQVMNFTFLLEQGCSKEFIVNHTEEFFKFHTRLFAGYSVRPENTDNAWVETIAMHYHEYDRNGISLLPTRRTPNKSKLMVRWMDVSKRNSIYWVDTCRELIQKAAQLTGSHW